MFADSFELEVVGAGKVVAWSCAGLLPVICTIADPTTIRVRTNAIRIGPESIATERDTAIYLTFILAMENGRSLTNFRIFLDISRK